MTIFDIGYEKSGLSDFVATLCAARVNLLVDVRERPQSRRAGFSKRMLAATVAAEGIAYRHMKPLGTPPEGRALHRTGDLSGFWQVYETQFATDEAQAAMTELADLAGQATLCLMCYEADWRVCHRRRIVEQLQALGFATEHLIVEPHFD